MFVYSVPQKNSATYQPNLVASVCHHILPCPIILNLQLSFSVGMFLVDIVSLSEENYNTIHYHNLAIADTAFYLVEQSINNLICKIITTYTFNQAELLGFTHIK